MRKSTKAKDNLGPTSTIKSWEKRGKLKVAVRTDGKRKSKKEKGKVT